MFSQQLHRGDQRRSKMKIPVQSCLARLCRTKPFPVIVVRRSKSQVTFFHSPGTFLLLRGQALGDFDRENVKPSTTSFKKIPESFLYLLTRHFLSCCLTKNERVRQSQYYVCTYVGITQTPANTIANNPPFFVKLSDKK